MSYCCDRFKDVVDEGRIEFYPVTRKWKVIGCCGECYVLTLHYCPFCGAEL